MSLTRTSCVLRSQYHTFGILLWYLKQKSFLNHFSLTFDRVKAENFYLPPAFHRHSWYFSFGPFHSNSPVKIDCSCKVVMQQRFHHLKHSLPCTTNTKKPAKRLSYRAVSQLKVELQFAIKFSYFREFWKSTKVQFIGQKLNFNFCPTHGLTFLSCNSNEVQRERSGPL